MSIEGATTADAAVAEAKQRAAAREGKRREELGLQKGKRRRAGEATEGKTEEEAVGRAEAMGKRAAVLLAAAEAEAAMPRGEQTRRRLIRS